MSAPLTAQHPQLYYIVAKRLNRSLPMAATHFLKNCVTLMESVNITLMERVNIFFKIT